MLSHMKIIAAILEVLHGLIAGAVCMTFQFSIIIACGHLFYCLFNAPDLGMVVGLVVGAAVIYWLAWLDKPWINFFLP